jgi:hypothetical protein
MGVLSSWRGRTGTPLVLSTLLALLLAHAAAAAPLPDVLVPAENPITASKTILGKILFWDEQLSSDDTVACGTCHLTEIGGSDPRNGERPAGAELRRQSRHDPGGRDVELRLLACECWSRLHEHRDGDGHAAERPGCERPGHCGSRRRDASRGAGGGLVAAALAGRRPAVDRPKMARPSPSARGPALVPRGVAMAL